MNNIQLLLLTGVAFIGFYFIVRLRRRLLDIVFLVLLLSCAAVFIIWPDMTTRLAKFLGVGRGADLVFYISILIFWFVILKLYVRIRKLEQTFTELIRQDALQKAQQPDNTSSLSGNNKQ
ncbi:MAG: DUF2304 domain-containing protein [Chitinophagaceae bacterium]